VRTKQRQEVQVNKKWLVYAGLVLAGVVLSNKIRALPGGNKIPTL
jgi:hypothetical protein